ncbi:Acetyltransferase, GNAT family [Aphelenchoides fujianensis]|nr:Acetyltransferase, GNAT family [Aphelenchoides fujianensis]
MSVAKRLIARTILAKVYQNDKCARRFYAPLPTEPCAPPPHSPWHNASRKKLPEMIKGKVHYELAHPEDERRILEFVEREIVPYSPLFQVTGAKPRDLLDLYGPIVERSLKDHCSLLTFAGEDLVGISLHTLHEFDARKDGQWGPREIVERKDFAKEIREAPFKHPAAKKLHVFFEQLRAKFEDLLPGCHKALVIELGGVAKKYRGRHISHEMVNNAMQLARHEGCDAIVTYRADSKAAQNLLREFNLDSFKEGPAAAFPEPDEDVPHQIVSGKLLAKRL